MSAPGVEVPFAALVKGFLVAAAAQNFAAVVVAMPHAQIGGGSQMIASNTGQDGVNKARALLLVNGGAVVDRTAKALHSFRLVGADGQIVPESNMCLYGPCIAAGSAHTEWESLPAEVQDAHRFIVQMLLGVAMTEPEPVAKSRLIVPGGQG